MTTRTAGGMVAPLTGRFCLPTLGVCLLLSAAASTATAADKPLKVFILAGQSNMQGHASTSTFDSLADDPKTAPLLKEMRTPDGKPRVCEKVWISSVGCLGDAYSDLQERKGNLTAGFGAPTEKIGPEFTFGIYMEKMLGEPVLIIKTSWGGRSLHTDFRPPSAGPYAWSDYELTQCKRRGDDLEKIKAEKVKATGLFYRHMIEHVKKVLADVKRVMPDYDPKQGYELAGFVWFQGFNDLVSDWTYDRQMKPGGYDMYGKLLTQFIRDVRKDLSAPKMPFVIGVMGIGGVQEGKKAPQLYFRQAQAAPASLPEFKGNVVAVETAPFWDDELDVLRQRMEKIEAKLEQAARKDPKLKQAAKDAARKMAIEEHFMPEELKRLKGVSNGGYHYLGAAKILAPIGKAFAEAMPNVRKTPDDSSPEPKKPTEKGAQAKSDAAGDPLPQLAVSRLGTLRWAHGTEVDYASYLHGGQQVLTVDQDGLFRVWDTPTGRLLRQFGKSDCTQLYWYVYHKNEKSKVIEVVGNPQSKHVVAVAADGETVAISHGDGNISLWDIATGKKLRTFTANVATTLAFTPDGTALFTRGLDQLVRQYNVRTGKEIRTFGGPRSDEKLIYCNDTGGLMVSADNKTVFSIHLERQDGQARVSVRSWEIATGQELPALKGKKVSKGLTSVAFSRQAKLVAFRDLSGVIHVWDLIATKEVHHLTGPEPANSGYSAALTFSPDGKHLVTRSDYTRMCLWDLVAGKELRQFQIPKDRPSDFYTGDLAFSPDGLRLISPGRAGTVRQLETRSGKEVELPVSRHRDLVETLALSPDGKTVVTLSHDHVLHLWNADDSTEIRQAQLPKRINRASFSGDGKVLALTGYGEKLHLRLWDAVHLRELREWEVSSELDGRPTPFPRYVGALALSASGRRLAVRDFDSSIKLWEVAAEKDKPVKEYRLAGETGEEHHFFRGQKLALSPDGTLLADLVSEKEGQISLRLWEVTTGKLVRMFDLPQPLIREFAFSPDGRTIATTNADRSISLWEVASGKERACLGRERLGEPSPDQPENARPSMLGDHLLSGELMCIAFSPDGNLLAAGDSSGRVRLFDLTTAKELDALAGHIGPVVSLAFAANSMRLVSGSTDTTALLWDVTPQPSEASPRRNLDQKQLESLWQDLRGADAQKAYQAIRVLRQFPKQVVPFFQARLRPLEVDQKQLTRLLGDLDSDDFATREMAQEELEKLGELAEDAIQKALDARPTPEVRRRLEALRTRPQNDISPAPDQVRALEVLESIGTSEAQQVVQIMARGAIVARITRDARATFERMGSKSK